MLVFVVALQPSGTVDSLDAKIERLVKDWNHGSDMLFSIHPADGSLLIWLVGFAWLALYCTSMLGPSHRRYKLSPEVWF